MGKKGNLKQELLFAFLIFIAVGLCCFFNIFRNAEYVISDKLCQKPIGYSPDIVIIAIDDKTLNEYGVISGWNRDIPAALINRLNADEANRPVVIGMDVMYNETGDPESDARFVEACGITDNVCIVSAYHFDNEFGNLDYVLRPFPELLKKVSTGFANTIIDPDGIIRRVRLHMAEGAEEDMIFSWKLYEMYCDRTGQTACRPKTDGEGEYFSFSYFGKAGSYSAFSLCDVLDESFDMRLFRDKIVLVGAYAEGMQDSFTPAIAHGSQMYGVEIHANIVDALMRGRTQIPMNRVLAAVMNGLFAAVFFLILRRLKVVFSIVAFVVMTGIDIACCLLFYSLGYIVPVAILPIAGLVILGAHILESYLTEAKRRRQVTGAFKQYVAPEIVEKVSRDKDFKLVLGGENRHIAVLFVDIRGFTTMSESLEPEQVVEILNEYLALTTKSILDNGGTLDKFVGDATMAVFNAPFDLEDYVYKAVCAARDMRAGADAITEKFVKQFGKSVSFGIGVNCGNAVVGNIGCEFRMDYTAIGDTVNTAARLESNAKRGQILISDSVYEILKDRLEVTPVGEIPLKGKSKGVFVYSVDEVK